MKNIYLAVPFFFIFFTGCSSTYKVSDFSSKEKFYDEFNTSFKTKEMKVTLLNDSSFTASDGTEIKNDTLISYMKLEEKRNRIFALSEIAEINYLKNDYQKASVVLKNGDELRTENVKVTHDSINFVEIKNLITKTNTPIDKVKTVGYKSRWIRVPLGAIAGLASGGIIGVSIGSLLGEYESQPAPLVKTDQHPPSPTEKAFSYWFSGAFIGLITGGVLGYIVGYTVYYQFNP